MTKDLKDENGKRIHPYVPELCEQLRKGKVDRREFLRTVCLLGVSASAAYGMAGQILGEGSPMRSALAEEPKQGGTLKFGMQVQEMTDDRIKKVDTLIVAFLNYFSVQGNSFKKTPSATGPSQPFSQAWEKGWG